MSKMDECEKILVEYPLIVSSEDRTLWEGFITIMELQYLLSIRTPNFPSIKDISLHCSPEIMRLIHPQMENLRHSSSLIEVLNTITHVCKLNMKNLTVDISGIKERTTRCMFMINELKNEIGEENIEYLDEDLKTVKVSYCDYTCEKHTLVFSCVDYPKSPLVIKEVDLPNEAKNEISGLMTFRDLYHRFIEFVELLVPFWNMLKEIEENTWVIDPQHPQKCDTYRRIFLNDDISVIVSLNPLKPSDVPDVKFLGTIDASENMRRLYYKNFKAMSWNTEQSILDNLKVLLEVEQFPLKPVLSPYEGMLGPTTCSICFSDEQEPNQLPPSKWCNNPKCDSRYHIECILHWFESLRNIQRFFTYISGPCPYCDGKVLCPADNCKI